MPGVPVVPGELVVPDVPGVPGGCARCAWCAWGACPNNLTFECLVGVRGGYRLPVCLGCLGVWTM